MADYISREAAVKAFENADADVCESYRDGYCDWGFGRKNVNDIIAAIPTVDAVPVVRCRECEHYNPESYDISCDNPKGIMGPSEDDFCSYGKRKVKNND